MKVHQSCRVDVEKIPGIHIFSGQCFEQEGKCMHEVPTVAGVYFFYHAYCLCTIFHHGQHIRYH